jgi:hypothetical protein
MSENMEERLDVMKREIDALQIAITGQRTPWYKNVSTILSVVALSFSFGTTYVSYRHTEVQDIQNMRQELRGILQRLAALPKENLDITKRYKDDPSAINLAGGFVNQENALLSKQAAEIARKLPKDKVTATEYYSIAIALQNSYNIQLEKEFLKLCIENAKDFSDEIAALRLMANLEFIGGHPESGRVKYQEALNIFAKYPGYDPYTIASTDIWTELGWAGSEASLGTRSLVSQHLQNAENLLDTLAPGAGTNMLRSQVMQAKQQYTGAGAVTTVATGSQLSQVPPIAH